MANKRYTLTISKLVLFWILFVISSIFTYKGFVLLSPIIPHAGRLILTIFPVSLLYFVPLLITVMARRFDMAVGKKEKWKLLFGTTIATNSISLFAFVCSLIKYINAKKIIGTLTKYYPLDILIISLIVFVISLVFFILIMLRKDYLKEKTNQQYIKERTNALFTFLLAFASYHLGNVICSSGNVLSNPNDPNIPWVLANLFIMLLPTIGLILGGLYFFISPKIRRTVWIIFVSSFSFLVIAFYVWALVGFAINPSYYPESTQPLFLFGYPYFGLPLGILFIFVVCVFLIVYYSIVFIKSEKK